MNNLNIDPLHKAVSRQSLPEVIEALAQGAIVDGRDREGRTPLFYASKDGYLEIAKALIRSGADVNAQDRNKETPLHFAAREYRPELADLLIKSGANVSLKDVHGNTALLRAVFDSRGRRESIKLLISAGANKTEKNDSGVSPSDLAKSISNYDVNGFFLDQ